MIVITVLTKSECLTFKILSIKKILLFLEKWK